jgi:ketosteroid isomerase-like protein
MNPKRLLALALAACAVMYWLPVSADEEADHAALRLIRTNYMEAVNSKNPSKIAPHLAKEVSGVMVTGEEVKGFDGLVAYWKKIQDLIGPGGSYQVTVNADRTDFFGDVAVSRGNTDDIVRLGNGKELRFNSLWTAVCRKEDGAWKVFRMEATMDPVNNVFVKLQVQKAKFTYAVAGLVAGALLILVLQFLKRGTNRAAPPPSESGVNPS